MQKFERELIRCNARIARLENALYELVSSLTGAQRALDEFIYGAAEAIDKTDNICCEELEEYIAMEEGEYLERKTEDDN